MEYRMTEDAQGKMYELLEGLSGEQVARAFTDYYGMQLLSQDFAEFLLDEGYAWDADEVGLDVEEDEEDEEDE